MSIIEQQPRTLTEQAIDALASFEPMIDMVLSYADLTVAEDGIGRVEEAHKSVKRLRVDLDKKRKELNEGALHYQRTVNATAKTLTEKIEAVESRLSAERENYEAEKLHEKQAKEAAKQAVLNERVGRLSSAGVAVTDVAFISAMAADEFEFYFAKESRLAAEAKAESDRLEALRQEELKRQAEELRVRAEEMERKRLAEAERLRAEREAMEADRAEMRRQQAELNRQQAELRAKAEAEAAEQRRKEKEAEQARREAAAAPELEKLEAVRKATVEQAKQALSDAGLPVWSEWLMDEIQKAFDLSRDQIRKTL